MLTEIEVEPGALVLRSPALAAIGVQHAFTTRRGLGERELDVGELTPELASELARLCGRCGALPRELKQVHGAQVHDAHGDSPPAPPVADAQLGSDPDQVLLVRTADCVPILRREVELLREEGFG